MEMLNDPDYGNVVSARLTCGSLLAEICCAIELRKEELRLCLPFISLCATAQRSDQRQPEGQVAQLAQERLSALLWMLRAVIGLQNAGSVHGRG